MGEYDVKKVGRKKSKISVDGIELSCRVEEIKEGRTWHIYRKS